MLSRIEVLRIGAAALLMVSGLVSGPALAGPDAPAPYGKSGFLDRASELEGEHYLNELRLKLKEGSAGVASSGKTPGSAVTPAVTLAEPVVKEIYGIDDNLTAEIDDGGTRVRAVPGTQLSDGWRVVSIAPRAVTIEKKADKNGRKGAPKIVRTLEISFHVNPDVATSPYGAQAPYALPPLPPSPFPASTR